MNFLNRFDQPTAASYRALLVAFLGSLAGLGPAWHFSASTTFSYIPYGAFLLTLFGFFIADWGLNGRPRCYDPGRTFLTYSSTLSLAGLILYYFFYSAGAGPFAEELFTVPNILANVAFGITAPALLAAVYGLTFNAARQSYDRIPLLRIFALLTALAFPLLSMIFLETLMVEWIYNSF